MASHLLINIAGPVTNHSKINPTEYFSSHRHDHFPCNAQLNELDTDLSTSSDR